MWPLVKKENKAFGKWGKCFDRKSIAHKDEESS